MTTPIRVLRSPVIPAGFVHGFPERTGGVSTSSTWIAASERSSCRLAPLSRMGSRHFS